MQFLKGSLAVVALCINTVFFTLIICLLAIGKLISPNDKIKDWFRKMLASVAEAWISMNSIGLSLYGTRWDLEIPSELDREGCYLVNANHQSWVDIPVLQKSFNRKLPFFRFFIKSQLIWVPMLGLAWWALDFPFMKRISREQLKRNPELRGKDLESAREACEKFKNIPVSMMNFPEGTRFTPEKKKRTRSPYENLLIPKTGGNGQVMYALSDQLDGLVDVTIAYRIKEQETTTPTFWQLVSGQITDIRLRTQIRQIPENLLGKNFRDDRDARLEMNQWMNEIWSEKDALIDTLRDPQV